MLDSHLICDYPQVEGSELEVMSSFPWHAHTVDVLTIERPPRALHALMAARGYCVRAMLGNEVGDVLYVRRDAMRGGERISARRFATLPGTSNWRTAPCYSPKPLAVDVNEYISKADWCFS